MFHENWYSSFQCDDLMGLVKNVKDIKGSIVEIGCWEGKSTSHIANACYPEIVICNDNWIGSPEDLNVTRLAKERDVYSQFLINMDTLTKGNYSVEKKDCFEFLQNFNEPIKFIHIDAMHDYKNVFDTIQIVLPKMVKGGILCGDDFNNAHINREDLQGGVERAVREALPGFKNLTGGNLWYYTVE